MVSQQQNKQTGAGLTRWLTALAVCMLGFGSGVSLAEEQNMASIRVATFNVSMDATNYLASDQLTADGGAKAAAALSNALAAEHPQVKNIAEVIQRTRPDVLILNEFDYLPAAEGIDRFQKDFLAVGQNGAEPIEYPYVYLAPVNTGVPSGFDLDRDGSTKGPADAWGYGFYPGQYGMVVLSQFPIIQDQVRTFQHFKWQDMPQALQPMDPETEQPFFSAPAWQAMPLSSKSHWDVPVQVQGQALHLLVSHPTPPVFDGPENRNGKRNHDEIRFWADYVVRERADYIYDDTGHYGGLKPHQRFVIVGDLNASLEGDNIPGTIDQLLAHPLIQGDIKPSSLGGAAHSPDNPKGKHHTAAWRNRADYVLPSVFGIEVLESGVFWPTKDDALYRLVADRETGSDHRLVWLDLRLR